MKQKKVESIKEDKIRKYSIMYIDTIFRSSYMLIIVLLIHWVISYFYQFKNPVYSLLFFFFLIVIISPFLPKYSIGTKVYDKYIKFLDRIYGRKN